MRIKVRDSREGLHPNERVVIIDTLTGPQELVVDQRADQTMFIDVGYPVATHGTNYLVELPSETSQGAWRVWVNKDTLLNGALEAAE